MLPQKSKLYIYYGLNDLKDIHSVLYLEAHSELGQLTMTVPNGREVGNFTKWPGSPSSPCDTPRHARAFSHQNPLTGRGFCFAFDAIIDQLYNDCPKNHAGTSMAVRNFSGTRSTGARTGPSLPS